ncbi:MAG: hypothetical protein ACYDH9_27670, partial [Limisphaerales bacterium]
LGRLPADFFHAQGLQVGQSADDGFRRFNDRRLRPATHPVARRFALPLTMAEALDWIEEFLKNPAVSLLEPSRASMDQTLRWMREFKLGRNRH